MLPSLWKSSFSCALPSRPAGGISKDVRLCQRSVHVFCFWKQLVEGKTATGKPLGDILHYRPTEGSFVILPYSNIALTAGGNDPTHKWWWAFVCLLSWTRNPVHTGNVCRSDTQAVNYSFIVLNNRHFMFVWHAHSSRGHDSFSPTLRPNLSIVLKMSFIIGYNNEFPPFYPLQVTSIRKVKSQSFLLKDYFFLM